MKRFFKYLLVFIMIFSISITSVSAAHFECSINASPHSLNSVGQPVGKYYFRYAKVTVKANNSKALYKVAFVGANYASSSNFNSLGKSGFKLSGSKEYTVYVLPRSGMNCPVNNGYCFGSGKVTTSTTIINDYDCSTGMCKAYGIGIYNETSTNFKVTVKYDLLY